MPKGTEIRGLDLNGLSSGKLSEEETLKEAAQPDVAQAAFLAALDALEDITRPLDFLEAQRVLKPLAQKVGVSPEVFTGKVLEEARRWTEGVLEGFWEALGISSPPTEVAEVLKKGGLVRLWCPWGRKGPLGVVSVFAKVGSGDRFLRNDLDLPFPDRACPSAFVLWAHTGRVEVNIPPRFFARRGRVLFHTRAPRIIRKALGEVAPLRPLFEAMGLPNLEEALEDLAGLRDGEIRQKGPYLLARKGRRRVLKQRSYFDDPALEASFLVGERVVLTYEDGVEVALKGILSEARVFLEEASIGWGHEVVQLDKVNPTSTYALDDLAPVHLFKSCLDWTHFLNTASLRSVGTGSPRCSPRMRALIAELASEKNPLEALKDKDFFRRVQLSHLAHF
jgi:hypothetical protein